MVFTVMASPRILFKKFKSKYPIFTSTMSLYGVSERLEEVVKRNDSFGTHSETLNSSCRRDDKKD